jgi:hypothetical protein
MVAINIYFTVYNVSKNNWWLFHVDNGQLHKRVKVQGRSHSESPCDTGRRFASAHSKDRAG